MVFDVLNGHATIKLTEEDVLLQKFLTVAVSSFLSIECDQKLKIPQTSVRQCMKASWDQLYCATQLSTIYDTYKEFNTTSGRNTEVQRPGSNIFGYFAGLEEVLN